MLLIGAELLRIGKNLYVTKSEPGANPAVTTRRKNIKHRNGVKQDAFSIIITFCKTITPNNKPPETAVFCYTEKNNKNKSLNGKLFKIKNYYKIIETNNTFHVPCCYIEKIRIIKSAIQKTLILVFILKHGEKQTKNPSNTNIKRQ